MDGPATRPDPARWTGEGLTAAWLGHATVLLDLCGVRILTDPALGERIGVHLGGPVVLGPRRLVAPALRAGELGRVDLVLLSHAHMDHTDLWTLRHLPRETPVVAAPGMDDLLRRFRHRTLLRWGASVRVAGVEVTAVPVRHWGARTVWDRHRGFGGYLLGREGRRVLFAGDTAYTPELARAVAARPPELAILPIGAYDPWIWNHASPEQAWRMFRETGGAYLMPVHHATFRLSREPAGEPLARLRAAAAAEGAGDRIVGAALGETVTLPAPR